MGLKLPIYGTDGELVAEQHNANPAWIVLDMLRRAGWGLGEIDAASFGERRLCRRGDRGAGSSETRLHCAVRMQPGAAEATGSGGRGPRRAEFGAAAVDIWSAGKSSCGWRTRWPTERPVSRRGRTRRKYSRGDGRATNSRGARFCGTRTATGGAAVYAQLGGHAEPVDGGVQDRLNVISAG